MKSPPAAIFWEIWGANRSNFAVAIGAVPACAVGYRAGAGLLRESDTLMALSYIPMVVSLLALFGGCAYTGSGRSGEAAGFPPRAFILPARTFTLVSVPLLFGSLSVALLWAGWSLVFRPLGVQMDIIWPAALLATAMIGYQSILWLLGSLRILRILALAFGGTAIMVIVVVAYSTRFPGIEGLKRAMPFILAGMACAGYMGALVGVGKQRHGGSYLAGWRNALARRLERASLRPVAARPREFKSAMAAQCWYEWRRNGRFLPIAASVILLLSLIGRDQGLDKLRLCLAIPIAMAAVIGKGFAKPDFWSLRQAQPTFIALRPISAGQYVLAKLNAAGMSVAATWLAFLLIVPALIALRCDPTSLVTAWQHFGETYPLAVRWALVPLLVCGIVLWTWMLMINSLYAGLWGRPWAYYGSILWSFVAAPCIWLVLAWALVPLLSGVRAESPNTMLRVVPQLAWILAAGFLLKIWISVFATRHSIKRGLITWRGAMGYFTLWLSATAILSTLALMVLSPTDLSPYLSTWIKPYVLMIVALQVPMARIALSPLALSSARAQ